MPEIHFFFEVDSAAAIRSLEQVSDITREKMMRAIMSNVRLHYLSPRDWDRIQFFEELRKERKREARAMLESLRDTATGERRLSYERALIYL